MCTSESRVRMREMEWSDEEMLKGQAKIWESIFGFVDGIALNCAVQLGIPDIINSHGKPLSIFSIAKAINNPTLSIERLSRVMTILVRREIFSIINNNKDSEKSSDFNDNILYGLTSASIWLLRSSKSSLASMTLLQHHPVYQLAWQNLINIVKNGGDDFIKTSHAGSSLWGYASANPEFNTIFNEAMAGSSKMVADAFLANYKGKFNGVRSVVDVAGGTGTLVSEIIKAHPHIKGINFDLPHVVAEAPAYDGVTHIDGDMFEKIPSADVVIIKWILHNWNDEDCIKILKNCQKALPEDGRVVIIDAVLSPGGEGIFNELEWISDIAMLVQLNARERNESQWKKLLEEAGFSTYKIIKIPAQSSIIEAYI